MQFFSCITVRVCITVRFVTKTEVITMRPNPNDQKLLEGLYAKLGVGKTQLLRMAIRSLAKAHKVTLKTA